MALIDEIKEELNYLKLWLGIIVVTNISLISWLIGNYEKSVNFKILADIFAIITLTFTVIFINKKIKQKIKSLREL